MPAQTVIRIFGPYTTAERDALVSGGNTVPTYTMIFNSDSGNFEFWTGVIWESVPGQNPTFSGTVSANTVDVGATSVYLSPAGLTVGNEGVIELATGRLKASQGDDVASANNLVLGNGGNAFEITGATQVDLISANNWSLGSQVTLLFSSTPTVKHGQAISGINYTILLAGAVDFVATAGDTLTLLLCEIGGVQAWREISRAVI